LSVVSNDISHDGRVLKEAAIIRQAGHEVQFIGWYGKGRPGPLGLVRWWRREMRRALHTDFDAIHAHDLDALPIGVALKKETHRPLVYDAHEIFPYMIEDDSPFLARAAAHLERRLAPFADEVIAVNEPVKEYVDAVSGNSAIIVRNCSDWPLDDYTPPKSDNPFTLLYIGTLHPSRFVLEAIEVVKDMEGFRLLIGGNKMLQEEVRKKCQSHPYHTVFLGEVPNDQVRAHTLRANAILCLFDPRSRINQVGTPTKLFEAMAAGRPSITTIDLPMSEIPERERCGISVTYSKDGLRLALDALQSQPHLCEGMGRNGLAAARREYNWPNEARKLVKLYEGIGG